MKTTDKVRIHSLEQRIESLRHSLKAAEAAVANFDVLEPGQLKSINELAITMRQRLRETWDERTALLDQIEN